MSQPTVFCRDCRHWFAAGFRCSSYCHHPQALIRVDPVQGFRHYQHAHDMRYDESGCGLAGKLYEPSEKTRDSDDPSVKPIPWWNRVLRRKK